MGTLSFHIVGWRNTLFYESHVQHRRQLGPFISKIAENGQLLILLFLPCFISPRIRLHQNWSIAAILVLHHLHPHSPALTVKNLLIGHFGAWPCCLFPKLNLLSHKCNIASLLLLPRLNVLTISFHLWSQFSCLQPSLALLHYIDSMYTFGREGIPL